MKNIYEGRENESRGLENTGWFDRVRFELRTGRLNPSGQFSEIHYMAEPPRSSPLSQRQSGYNFGNSGGKQGAA